MSIYFEKVGAPTPGADVGHDVDMLDRDQVEQHERLTKQKEEYTKQIGPLERQYTKMVKCKFKHMLTTAKIKSK